MSAHVDLTHAPVVDVHCHPWRNDDVLALDPAGFEDRITMLGMCLISSGLGGETARTLERFTDSTPLALAMRRRLAEHLGCEATRAAVADARREAFAAGPAAYNHRLWESANVAGLVYDEGYPQPTIPRERFAADSAATVHRVARIEPFIAELLDRVESFAELEGRFAEKLDEAAADPACVAFKSVIAYRTGLDVGDEAPDGYCERAFERWRDDGFEESRLHAKPIRDRLLRRTLEAAKRADRPVHVHCGGGDPAIVLQHARPQDLFPLLAEYADQPIVLIHSGWPWLEEAAYVASVLPQVYLDLSITIPWASLAIDQKLEVLLGAAPPAKVLYGSDEATEPEVIWLAAQLGREALSRVLGTAIERHWLTAEDALRLGEGVLAGNTRRLHAI